jgi:hypothetical protein
MSQLLHIDSELRTNGCTRSGRKTTLVGWRRRPAAGGLTQRIMCMKRCCEWRKEATGRCVPLAGCRASPGQPLL